MKKCEVKFENQESSTGRNQGLINVKVPGHGGKPLFHAGDGTDVPTFSFAASFGVLVGDVFWKTEHTQKL